MIREKYFLTSCHLRIKSTNISQFGIKFICQKSAKTAKLIGTVNIGVFSYLCQSVKKVLFFLNTYQLRNNWRL